jgi:hypothetical protein
VGAPHAIARVGERVDAPRAPPAIARAGERVGAPPAPVVTHERWVELLLHHLHRHWDASPGDRWVPIGRLGHQVPTPGDRKGKFRAFLEQDRRFVLCKCQRPAMARVRAAGPDFWPDEVHDCKCRGGGAGHA